ncbi:hypothetical protein EMIT036CA2_30398 [Chryseobacterium sp. IT-36CA2]
MKFGELLIVNDEFIKKRCFDHAQDDTSNTTCSNFKVNY